MHRASRPLRWARIPTTLGLACALATAAAAQILPLGNEFQVNTYTTDNQTGPVITMAADGGFTVIWCCGDSPGGEAVVGRRFDPQGVPLGGELVLDQHQNGWTPDLAADAADNFVLVWGQGRNGCPGCFSDYVKGHRFTGEAVPLGEQFVISPPPGGIYTGDGSVAVHPGGSFVVAWNDYDADACEFIVSAQRFAGDGTPEGGPIPLAGGTDNPWEPSVAAESDGGFLVLWDQYDPAAGESAVVGRRYDADGLPVGGDLEVSGPAPLLFENDLAAQPDGSFVAAWIAAEEWPHGDVMARRLTASGQPVGAAFAVESYTGGGLPFDVEVSPAPDGTFVVSWSDSGSAGSDSSAKSIQARRFASEGTPLGSQFQVNSYTTSDQWFAGVAFQANGDFVVAWASYGSDGSDTSSSSVQARRFRPPFFMDGFESGDTSRW
jgi:hypothetical protein